MPEQSNPSPPKIRFEFLFVSLVVLFAAFLVRFPLIDAGLPYLYREDDTHHFNRTVEMVKRRDLNPYYFHKPSLHFYVRMPVVWLTAQWMKARGGIASVKDVRTRDPYGLAGYNFTASHPLFVKTNRLLSIVMSLLAAFVSMLIAYRLGVSAAITAVCGLVIALSPEFLVNSPIVGVDMLMALLTVLASWLALETLWSYSPRSLYLVALTSGLAISSKYNAAPIAILPFIVLALKKDFSIIRWILAGQLIAVGFFLGSPYILVSLPTFIEQLSYEVWHYRVAGHEGHSAEPGIDQAVFYFKWLITDGVGYIATLFAAIGSVALVRRHPRNAAVVLSFPVLFAGLMIAQRTNFTRNMVPVIPYAAICAAIGIQWIAICSGKFRLLIVVAMSTVTLFPLGLASLRLIFDEVTAAESRREVVKWIDRSYHLGNIAASGELLLPIQTFYLAGVDAFDPHKTPIFKLVQAGYTFFVVPSSMPPDVESMPLLRKLTHFGGDKELGRIVKNPAVDIYTFTGEINGILSQEDWVPKRTLRLKRKDEQSASCIDGAEQYCWISSRVTELNLSSNEIPTAHKQISMELMSPWPNQLVSILLDEKEIAQWKPSAAGEWSTVAFSVSGTELATKKLRLSVRDIHSPLSLGLSQDSRRLGVAIRSVSF